MDRRVPLARRPVPPVGRNRPPAWITSRAQTSASAPAPPPRGSASPNRREASTSAVSWSASVAALRSAGPSTSRRGAGLRGSGGSRASRRHLVERRAVARPHGAEQRVRLPFRRGGSTLVARDHAPALDVARSGRSSERRARPARAPARRAPPCPGRRGRGRGGGPRGEEEPAGDPHARDARWCPSVSEERRSDHGRRAPLGEPGGERAPVPSGCSGGSRTPGRVTAAARPRRRSAPATRRGSRPAGRVRTRHPLVLPPAAADELRLGAALDVHRAAQIDPEARSAFRELVHWPRRSRVDEQDPTVAVDADGGRGEAPVRRGPFFRSHDTRRIDCERAVALRGALEILAIAIDDPDRRGAAGDGIEREHGAVLRHRAAGSRGRVCA